MNAGQVRQKLKHPQSTSPPRIGVLTPHEFEVTMEEVFGGRGWQSVFAKGSGLAPSTVTRYLQGVFPIPQYVGLIVEMLLTLRRNGLPVPVSFALEAAAAAPKVKGAATIAAED